jgi:hypothetical protein
MLAEGNIVVADVVCGGVGLLESDVTLTVGVMTVSVLAVPVTEKDSTSKVVVSVTG